MQLPIINMGAISAEIIVVVTGLLVLAVDIFSKSERRGVLSLISLAGLLAGLFAVAAVMAQNISEPTFSGMVLSDQFAQFFKTIFLLSAGFTILISPRYLRINNIQQGEYFELILFCTFGMMVMASAGDLVTIYIGLELMAIALYLMAGFHTENKRSSEAAIKYFLLGAFASALLLYGMSFLYGVTGTTNLAGIHEYLDRVKDTGNPAMMINYKTVMLSLVLMTVGFAFKIAAVPFHMWTPDVYEGAPTPLTAFMSVGPKVAGFAVLMRVYMVSFQTLAADWVLLFSALAMLTMIVGNVVAVAQQSVKRMLAYSSIAHAGYLLVGVVSAGSLGVGTTLSTSESMVAVMVYLFSYMFMNMGAFAILISLGKTGEPRESLSDFAGLAKRRPMAAALMTVLLLSLAGIPGTFGFIGKFYIFMAALRTGNVSLAVIGVLASVIGAFYYIRVIVYMYMRDHEGDVSPDVEPARATMYAAIATTMFTIAFGLFPRVIIEMAREAVVQFLA
jgi:NADH-quinone oxidoreductase subunit N